MHVQSCCFANQSKPEAVICFCLNLLLFCRSRCRHRRHCLTLITPTPPTKHRVKKKRRFECGQCCLHHGGVRLLFHSYHLFLKSLFITAYNRRQRPLLIFQTTQSGTHDLQKISCHMSPHSASRFFLTSCHVSPTANRDFFLSFFFVCLNLMLHEPTQRITIFLTSCQVSPHSATFFFSFLCKSLIT